MAGCSHDPGELSGGGRLERWAENNQRGKVWIEEVSDSTVGYQTAKTDGEQNAKGFRILGNTGFRLHPERVKKLLKTRGRGT